MIEALAAFVELKSLHPVVAKRFSFEEAPAAYRYLDEGQASGKVVIDVS